MSESWDAEAATFDDAPDHGLRDPSIRAAWRQLLLTHLPHAPARVADLGFATGTLSVLLADEGYTVDGVDFSAAMVERARIKAADRENVSFVLGDAAHPPLAAGEYDVVLCRHVLWALPDPSAVLARWVKLLTPGWPTRDTPSMALTSPRPWSSGRASRLLTARTCRSSWETLPTRRWPRASTTSCSAGTSCGRCPIPPPSWLAGSSC